LKRELPPTAKPYREEFHGDAPGIAELIRARAMASFPRAALGRGFSPIRSFQKDHAAPSVRSGLQRSTEIAGNALPLDQLRAIEHFDRPERTIVTSDAGNPSH